MARRKRTPEENERREKIRELLSLSNVGSMEDIQNLFKETIAEFMENGLEAELDDELGTAGMITGARTPRTAATVTAAKRCAQVSVMSKYLFPATEKANLSRRF